MSCRTCERIRQYLPAELAQRLRRVEERRLIRRAEKRAAKLAGAARTVEEGR